MKTVRFIATVVFLFFFMIGNAYSQSKKSTNCETLSPEILDCVGEVTGEIEYCLINFGNGKIQQKWKGILEGADDTYIVSQVFNCNLNKLFNLWISNNGTQTMTMSIVSETTGMVVGEYHHTYHITLNANGEMSVETWKQWSKCY